MLGTGLLVTMYTTQTLIDKWRFNITQLKEMFTFSVKRQISIKLCYLYQRLIVYSFKLNLFISLLTAVSILKGKRHVLIYFCYQTDIGLSNTSIYSAVFLASLYYNYL